MTDGVNPYVLDDEDDTETVQVGSENANFKQLREYAKKLERENKQLTRENGSLLEFKTNTEQQVRASQIAAAFTEAGLSPKHGALFQKLNPEGEVTADAVSQFAAEFDLPLARGSQEAAGAESVEPSQSFGDGQIRNLDPGSSVGAPADVADAPTPGSFAPVQGQGSVAASYITDTAEAERLSIENPSEYARLRAAGRIRLDRLPGTVAP